MIRVGRRIYNKDGTHNDPHYNGFTPILCLTASSPYGELGPYVLKDDDGRIMENIWQFSKVYEKVPPTKEYYSRYNKKIIWQHPSEIHVKHGKLTNEYYSWRTKGMLNQYPVRYPVGYSNRNKCLYSIGGDQDNIEDPIDEHNKLDYISARKKIYLPVYTKLVVRCPKFHDLLKRFNTGENLLIIEVDGPHQESLEYYKEKYNVGDDFIENNTSLMNKKNIEIFLNDDKYPFGHGYCLAHVLLKYHK